MKIKKTDVKELIVFLGFKPQKSNKDIYYKNYSKHNEYILKVNFKQEIIEYGTKIKLGDLTTSNFENSENFVVLECVDRIIEKGYEPDKLSLEHKWSMGRKEKGKLDILVMDKKDKAYLMIECKTWGDEYEKEKKKMQRDGGQLFFYFQQDKAAQYLCLYTSKMFNGKIIFSNEIIKVDEQWKELNNQKEIFDHWNKNFKSNGIFEEWTNVYNIEIKALTKSHLKELTEEDSGRIFNQFAEILRHNVVSDKPNAFNKVFNLFLCKIVDEDRKSTEELKFQWRETDTDEELQKRLSDLYKQGMREYLTKEVTDYNDEQINEKLYDLDPVVRDQIREMFTRVRLHKNNEFAFKEVFDEKSFRENAVVVREIVELFQPYQIRYGHKQQFLGDFFELLLSTGIKQEAGQFFTPVPIAKFIISSLPIRELINRKIKNDENHFLPYIIDYAAGSGHFLTEAMDEVQTIIESLDENKQKPSIKRNIYNWKICPFDWAYDYMYGIEADYRLVKTAKVSCFLNGDGLANMIHADGLDHFKKSIDYKGKLKEISKDDKKDNSQFDILVANPPYSISAFKNTLKNGGDSFDLYCRLTDDSSEIECLFIERTKQLLKKGGWAGVILPSSILSNSGIYTDTREIILKYFNIKAIAEFGSNTFMATGTNTVTLFLERKVNNEWKKVEKAIKDFFDKPKEAKVNGIEKAFGKYVSEILEELSLTDYISFINKKPTELLQRHVYFADYKTWFNGLTEIKNIKTKEIFKRKTKEEQEAELDKIFYEKVFSMEQDKMLYFFLTYPQRIILLKVGEKQAEKQFLGYEFSNRRGSEGIHPIQRGKSIDECTQLFDTDVFDNPMKASTYIYKAFNNEFDLALPESLKQNLSYHNLVDMLTFDRVNFEKSISLSTKKRVKIESKWNQVKIGQIAKSLFAGGDLPKNDFSETPTEKYKIPIYTNSSKKNGLFGYTNKIRVNEPCITISARGTIGYTVVRNEPFFPIVRLLVLIPEIEKAMSKYLGIIINQIDFSFFGAPIPQLTVPQISEFKIPLPPLNIQKKIIIEIEKIEQKENEARYKVKKQKDQLKNIFLETSYDQVNLGNIAEFKSGLNYSQKSTGELVTIVGVKDFLEDFSPNLDKLVDVRIDGQLSESYKLQLGDILVVRSNGSANLVGRFIYIDKLNKTTSYSGFTIRIRIKSDKLNSKYLCYCLRTESVRNAITKDPKGANIKSVNQTMLSAIDVPLPPLDKQLEIIKKVEKSEKEIVQIERALAIMVEQKENILKKYLE